jgi:hypothetical protein
MEKLNFSTLAMTGGCPDRLYSPVSRRQPSARSIGAIIGPSIEGNRRGWGSSTNCVDDDLE